MTSNTPPTSPTFSTTQCHLVLGTIEQLHNTISSFLHTPVNQLDVKRSPPDQCRTNDSVLSSPVHAASGDVVAFEHWSGGDLLPSPSKKSKRTNCMDCHHKITKYNSRTVYNENRTFVGYRCNTCRRQQYEPSTSVYTSPAAAAATPAAHTRHSPSVALYSTHGWHKYELSPAGTEFKDYCTTNCLVRQQYKNYSMLHYALFYLFLFIYYILSCDFFYFYVLFCCISLLLEPSIFIRLAIK